MKSPAPTGLDGLAAPTADLDPGDRSSSPETRLTYKSDCSERSILLSWVFERPRSKTHPPFGGVGSTLFVTGTYQKRDTHQFGVARDLDGGVEQRKRSAAGAGRRLYRRPERRENRGGDAAPAEAGTLTGVPDPTRSADRAKRGRAPESDGRPRPSDLPVRRRRSR